MHNKRSIKKGGSENKILCHLFVILVVGLFCILIYNLFHQLCMLHQLMRDDIPNKIRVSVQDRISITGIRTKSSIPICLPFPLSSAAFLPKTKQYSLQKNFLHALALEFEITFILDLLKHSDRTGELTHCKGSMQSQGQGQKLPDFNKGPGACLTAGWTVLRKAVRRRLLNLLISINATSRSPHGQYRPWITMCHRPQLQRKALLLPKVSITHLSVNKDRGVLPNGMFQMFPTIFS